MKQRNEKGQFVSEKASAMLDEADQIETVAAEKAAGIRAEAEKLIQAETTPPEWLKALVVAIATELGISPEEFRERVRIVHPTPVDPVLIVDGKPMVAWV
jgi:hypothetical protein